MKDEIVAEGATEVERGNGVLSRIISGVIGFPDEGSDLPTKVEFQSFKGNEIWVRNIAGKTFHSIQSLGVGRYDRLLCESFGPVKVGLAVILDEGVLRMAVRKWEMFGIPMPLFLAPRGNAYEYENEDRFHFSVEISHPFIGLMVRYRGWLIPKNDIIK